MTNAYVSLDVLKDASALNIAGTDYDARLLALAEAASAVIDRRCNRHFFARRAALQFYGAGAARLLVPDLISVDPDGIRVDTAGDGAFAAIWDSADYRLLPLNADPASAGNPASQPYTQIEALNGRRFPAGSARTQVSGIWGWHQRLRRATERVGGETAADADTIALTGTASGLSKISAGNTLLIDDEQVYVRARADDALTVARGVNGTAATTHTAGGAIDVYEYPPPIAEAARLLAMRLWQGALADAASRNAACAQIDADIDTLISQYRKPALGIA